QGRYGEAEALSHRALIIYLNTFGDQHPLVGATFSNLARSYDAQGAQGDITPAEQLYNRTLMVFEKVLGPDHPDLGAYLDNLAAFHFRNRNWQRATYFWRRSTDVTVRRVRRGALNIGQTLTGKQKTETEQLKYRFQGLIRASFRITSDDRG